MRTLIIFLLVAIFLISCNSDQKELEMKLDETIKNHLQAIQDRDLESLLKTVNPDKITLILPNGKYSNSFEDYKKVNENWFAEKSWTVNYKIVDKTIKGSMGICLTEITYSDINENGENYSFKYFLTLIFEYDSEWRLIFDQNTIIK